MKYIDAEKLIAEIDRQIKEHKKALKKDNTFLMQVMIKSSLDVYESLKHFLSSFQQEQLEIPSGEEVMTMCNQILIDWGKEGKTPEEREQREQAHIRFFELYDEYMERPDVDLDAEIAIYLNRNVLNRINNTDIIEDFTTIEAGELARHFYALGLNARKEEGK